MKKRTPNLIRQFNIILVIVFLISVLTTGAFLSTWLYGEVERNMDRQVMLLLNVMQSNRDYTSDYIKTRLMEHQSDPDYFVPELVPSYAAHQTFMGFVDQGVGSDLLYKEATINPTNLRDEADEYEQTLIETFRQTQQQQLSGYRPWPTELNSHQEMYAQQRPNQKMYYVARPLVVDRESCLTCHGSPDDAPQDMIDLYGDRHGFNWQLNEVVAAQTVYIPAQSLLRQTLGELGRWMPINLAIFFGLALLVNQIFKRIMIRPILQITSVARRLSGPTQLPGLQSTLSFETSAFSDAIVSGQNNQGSKGNNQGYGDRLAKLGNRRDELGQLARSFDYMLHVLANREQDLQQAVMEKTAELAHAKQVADQANHAKSHFLAQMSHELRTPLNAILGFSQLMRRDRTLSSGQQDTVAIINNNGEHLLELINEVLDLAKIEAGKLTVENAPVDLHRLLYSVQQLFQAKATEKNLTLTVSSLNDVPQWIETDERRLKQVLMNLLGNAIKFTSLGSVTIQSHIQSDKLHIAVVDTGPGIAPNAIDAIFQPFSQSETGVRTGQGTGLGLPISRQCLELMGGQLDVSSSVGVGTTFHITLPCNLIAAPATPAGKPSYSFQASSSLIDQQQVLILAPNQPKYRILVADDSDEGRQLLTRLLTEVGFEVENVSNGQEAIARWHTWHPHLICMDLRMPIMDGYEATCHIKQHGAQISSQTTATSSRATKIVILTASALTHEQEAVRRSGCDAYLSKPFKSDELLATIGTLLNVAYCDAEQPDVFVSAAALQDSSPVPDALESIGRGGITTNDALSHTHYLRLTADEFQAVPLEWMQAMHAAILDLDEAAMQQLIDALPEHVQSLRAVLTHLVDILEFERILRCLEPHL